MCFHVFSVDLIKGTQCKQATEVASEIAAGQLSKHLTQSLYMLALHSGEDNPGVMKRSICLPLSDMNSQTFKGQ